MEFPVKNGCQKHQRWNDTETVWVPNAGYPKLPPYRPLPPIPPPLPPRPCPPRPPFPPPFPPPRPPCPGGDTKEIQEIVDKAVAVEKERAMAAEEALEAKIVPMSQVNADWEEEDPTKKSYIEHKITAISDAEIENLEE